MSKKPGKYAHVIGNLPRLPMVEPERRDIIEAVKEAITAPASDDNPATLGVPDAYIESADLAIKTTIEIMKRAAAGKPYATQYAKAYATIRAIDARIKQWEKNIGVLLEAYLSLMVEQMEVEGVTSLTLSNGQPIYTFLEPYAHVQDPEKFRDWCIAQGLLRRMSLHPAATSKLTKDRLLAGDPEPDGVAVFAKTKVRLGSE